MPSNSTNADSQDATSSSIESESKFSIYPLAIILLVAIAAAIIVTATYISHFPGEASTTHSRWGEFGDFVGGTLNPIFGFLTIISLLVTIKLQTKELAISSKSLARAAQAQEKQYKLLSNQSNEETFFRFLEEIRKDTYIKKCRKRSSSMCARLFEYIYQDGVDGADREIEPQQFRNDLSGVIKAGPAIQILIAKTTLVASIINRRNRKDRPLYIKLLQTELSPSLISFMVHYASIAAPNSFKEITESGILRGIAKDLFFRSQVAACMPENHFEGGYQSCREKLLESFRERHMGMALEQEKKNQRAN
ncbi:hypothetical protein [Stutzerimonas nitrititolerans]|uniref:hypothetical protein n=1 Tax=Stutzerimonas nitrititolerans TaxID=2482751 RepID=UPI0028A0A58A|nr:hypothetical protein [Stutzerimonas nitrititolerans]